MRNIEEGQYRVTDMIRATVILLSIGDLFEAYNILLSVPYLEVVKIKNKLDTELQNVSVLFMF